MLSYIFIDYSKVQIKILYERICYEWMIIKATHEINILKKYANISKQFVMAVTGNESIQLFRFRTFYFCMEIIKILLLKSEFDIVCYKY